MRHSVSVVRHTRRPPTAATPRSAVRAATSGGPLSKHPMFADIHDKSFQKVELVHGSWGDKFVVINKPAGLPSHDIAENLYASGVVKRDQMIHFPHRLDRYSEGLMVLAFDRFASGLLSRDLEAGRWVRRFRAIVEKAPCLCNADASVVRCCMLSSYTNGRLLKHGALVKDPIQISSFIAKCLSSNVTDRVTALWQKREEEKASAARTIICESGKEFIRVENPVPAYLRWHSVSEMHPEAKLCITRLQLLRENETHASYDITPVTARAHQVRVHLSDLGFPVVCDPYYNRMWITRQLKTPPEEWSKEATMLLQAYHLEFPDPYRARNVTVNLPWPSWQHPLAAEM